MLRNERPDANHVRLELNKVLDILYNALDGLEWCSHHDACPDLIAQILEPVETLQAVRMGHLPW